MASKAKKSSKRVDRCQVCGSNKLKSVLFVGYLPPVNELKKFGDRPEEETFYPAELLLCTGCTLVQLGSVVDPRILFPPTYPYTSGTTRILRENFAELAIDCDSVVPLTPKDLVVDIGSNDGTLLSNFVSKARVQGIEPSDRGKLGPAKGVPTLIAFFAKKSVEAVLKKSGPAKIITATNVFAHIDDVHDVVRNIKKLLGKKGVFISESHYLLSLVQTLQYDTIYHEHLRYYSLQSISCLLEKNGLEVVHAKRIPTHGGSIRVYSARKGKYPIQSSVKKLLAEEDSYGLGEERLKEFAKRVAQSKLDLLSLLKGLKEKGNKISAIGAPSRASTLITYVGIDEGILENVLETPGSFKIGKYMPGTLIPVLDESVLFENQPEYALLLSWHIAEELMPKIKKKGFRGDFIIPLPTPHIIKNSEVS